MRRYLLDTGIASDCINRRHGVDLRVRTARIRGDRVGLGIPVLAELCAGIELSETRERNFHQLRNWLPFFRLWPFDRAAAEEYGRVFANLQRRGRPMQQVDIQLAAIALSLGNCTIVSSDRDLAAVPGLAVENWSVV
jgi:tRNA(fMet)-specific endonuclease VapC